MEYQCASRIIISPTSCIIHSIAEWVSACLLLLQIDSIEFSSFAVDIKNEKETVFCRSVKMKQQYP